MLQDADFAQGLKLISSNAQTPENSTETKQSIKLNLDIYTDVFRRGYDQNNSVDVTNVAIDHLDFHLSNDVTSKLAADDFIEIYSKDCVQLFRTLNLTKLMSYSLETILSGSFEDLFDREEKYTGLIIQAAGKILKRESDFITDFCPEHVVSERYGKKNAVVMSYKFMCALTHPVTNELQGILVSERIKPLS